MVTESGAKVPLGVDGLFKDREKTMDGRAAAILENWPAVVEAYSGDEKIDTLSNGKQVRNA